MILDEKLTQLGLKMKNLVVLDLSWPNMQFSEFKSAYETRYIHLSSRQDSAVDFAAGLASLGKVVLIYGSRWEDLEIKDPSLNVKLVKQSKNAVWDYLDGKLMEFGPSVLLIPRDN